MNSYELVKIAKTKQGIESDRAFAINNGFTVQNISDWKAGRAIPNARNFLKLATCAEMSIEEALKFAEEMEAARFKQAGYSNLGMMGTLTGLSLIAVTHSPIMAAISGVAAGSMYIMLNQESADGCCYSRHSLLWESIT